MASNPDGQSCSTCSFYIIGECRASKPSVAVGSTSLFATPAPDSWCVEWNVWSGRPPVAAVGAACTSGTAAPSGGTDGDFYVLYSLIVAVGIVYVASLAIYQKQSGAWVVVQTIL